MAAYPRACTSHSCRQPLILARMHAGGRCPICGSSANRDFAAAIGLELRRCAACLHEFVRIDQLDVGEVEELYQGDYAGFWRDARFRRHVEATLDRSFVPRIPPPARLLDVGCGSGEFLEAAAARGYAAVGIDISRAGVAACRARGLDAHVAHIDEHRPDAPYDFVTLWDVVEHLTDPVAVLETAAGLLHDGGWIVIKTPCVRRRGFRLVRHLPSLERGLLHLPGHIQFFTPESMHAALETAGLRSIEILVIGAMRGRRPTRSLKRRLGQLRTRAAARLGGSRNILAFAQR
jgi:SAM-dependent methyltransferase